MARWLDGTYTSDLVGFCRLLGVLGLSGAELVLIGPVTCVFQLSHALLCLLSLNKRRAKRLTHTVVSAGYYIGQCNGEEPSKSIVSLSW